MKITFFLLAGLLLQAFGAFSQNIKGHYAIKNVKTGMLLRVRDAHSENGTPLVAYNAENWKCMTWEFNTTGVHVYQLQNLLTGKTFQPSSTASAGVPLVEESMGNGSSAQQYEFIKDKDDSYLIRLKGTNWYVTPEDKNGSTNSAIILAAKTDTPDQLWQIYKQDPT